MPLQITKRREQPAAHADHQGIGLLLVGRQLLVDQVLLRKIVRHPLQAVGEVA
jgi:hypothetical protein